MKAVRFLRRILRKTPPAPPNPSEAVIYMIFHGAPARGIIHVGANDAAEFDDYVRYGVGQVVWIEPLPEVFETLKRKVSAQPGHRAVEAACSYDDGLSVDLHVASNRGESSSILASSLHSRFFPEVTFDRRISLRTAKLDTLLDEQGLVASAYNLLVIDTQGSELMVLRGAPGVLAAVSAVYVEVSEVPLYEGGCTWMEVHDHLTGLGFSLKHLHIGQNYFGNAFYIRNAHTGNRLDEPRREGR